MLCRSIISANIQYYYNKEVVCNSLFVFSEGIVQPRGRILRPASLCHEMNIKRSGGPCQRYNGGQNEELAHIFLYIICKKTVNKRRGIKILRSFVNP